MIKDEEPQMAQLIEVGPVKVDTGDNTMDFAFVVFFILLLFILQLIYWKVTGK